MDPSRKVVAVYARVSSQRQAEELTIASQVAALRQRVVQDQHVLEDSRCFFDEGYSGSTLVRPALERLRDLAHSGAIDRLYVHAPDRLARNYVHQMLLLEEFSRQGVEVVFLNDIREHHSAEGTLLLQVQGMIAEYERAKILERTRRGRRHAARQGRISVIGHAPYGYRYITVAKGDGAARYEVVPEEARVVRSIFTWVGLEGLSLGDVVERLAEDRVPTRTGKTRWDRATIRGMLLNPAYTGTAKYGKTRLVPRSGERRPKRGDPVSPRWEKVAVAASVEEQESIPVPALIDADLFASAAVRLEENRRRQREQKKGAEFLLSGLLVCQQCGSAYCGRRLGPRRRYVYYRCLGTEAYRHEGHAVCHNQSLNGKRLEAAVWSDVCGLLEDPDRLRREVQRRLEQPESAREDATHCRESITQIKRRMSRLLDAYENGWMEKGEFDSRMQRHKDQLACEQKALAAIEGMVTQADDLQRLVTHFSTFAAQIHNGLHDADLATRRKTLRVLIKRIEVDNDEIRIVYKVQLHPFALRRNSGDLQHCLKSHSKAWGCRARGYPRSRADGSRTPEGFHSRNTRSCATPPGYNRPIRRVPGVAAAL